MKTVRQRDTSIERSVRRILRRLGAHYRICPNGLPGHPDIANAKWKWCVFVHGCFWHGHPGCKLAKTPRANRNWWMDKIDANRKRDGRKESALRDRGYHVTVVWQCELADELALEQRLAEFLANSLPER